MARSAPRPRALRLDDPDITSGQEAITIDKARRLPNASSPAAPRQRLIAFEVWGYAGKGQFSMRFNYVGHTTTSCIAVGQKIVNWARF